jgi:ABC-type multidrug transport system permease subunit
LEVTVNTQLDDEKISSLFAWISLAFRGETEYNNLMLAIVAIFGNLPPSSLPVQMMENARKQLPGEEELVGDKFSIEEREYNSLGYVSFVQG